MPDATPLPGFAPPLGRLIAATPRVTDTHTFCAPRGLSFTIAGLPGLAGAGVRTARRKSTLPLGADPIAGGPRLPSTSRAWTDEHLLPHESAAHELWEDSGDAWLRAPGRERSTLRTIAGVILIMFGAYGGQMTLLAGMSVVLTSAFGGPRSAVLAPLFSTIAGGVFAAACLYAGIKMVSGRPAHVRR